MRDHGRLSAAGSSAFEKALLYIQNNDFPSDNRRIACTEDGVVAVSGMKQVDAATRRAEFGNAKFRAIDFAQKFHRVDISTRDMIQRFSQMVQKYQVTKQETWEIDNCAEASLWMTLEAIQASTEMPGHPARHPHTHRKFQRIWVYEIDRKFRPKPDGPCKTCRQWARLEFQMINGTIWK